MLLYILTYFFIKDDFNFQRTESKNRNLAIEVYNYDENDSMRHQQRHLRFHDLCRLKLVLFLFFLFLTKEPFLASIKLANCYIQFLYISFTYICTNWVYTFQSYLSEKGLVHRDLAARNVLVGHGKKLKIGDFGLMREMYHELYEVKKQKKLPIKWLAPEAIFEQIFTSKSDVYVLYSTYNTAEYKLVKHRFKVTLRVCVWVCAAV